MELLNRDEREKKVAEALKMLHGKLLKQLLAYLGDPPNPARVPDSFWSKVEREYRRSLTPLLFLLYLDAANQLVPDLVTKKDAQHWADDYAEEIASGVADHSREWFDAAKSRHLETEDGATLLDSSRSIFGEPRAQGIAATEVTRASVRGMSDAAERYNESVKDTDDGPRKELVAYWNSERDSKVCPICRPLNGKPLRNWGSDFPDGPPAHPNCRCWLDYKQGLKAENFIKKAITT